MPISIVTATYNAQTHLPALIASLRAQTNKNFEWIVADGGSTDNTLALLADARDLNIIISSQPDFGIYDALNRAVRLASNEYYIVMGADDYFFPDAVENFQAAGIKYNTDIISAVVFSGGRILKAREGKSWRFGANGFISNHSAGASFKKSLHQKYGYYSPQFPIAADQLFVIQACKGGATRHVEKFVAGEFGTAGISSTDYLGTVLEFFRVQIITGHNKSIQVILLFLRLLRNYWKY